jgi:hypothetical protein
VAASYGLVRPQLRSELRQDRGAQG